MNVDKLSYTIKEFSEMFSLKESTVRTNITRNPQSLPPVVRFGRSIRFMAEDVQNWVRENKAA